MLHNVREITFQDIAQPIQRAGGDAFVMPEPGKLGFADVIGLVERLIWDALWRSRFPQFVKFYHNLSYSFGCFSFIIAVIWIQHKVPKSEPP